MLGETFPGQFGDAMVNVWKLFSLVRVFSVVVLH